MQRKISHATPLYLSSHIRRIEARHANEPLMERAGLAAAQRARQLVTDSGKPILILCGPGNNGGDGFVVARHLKQWFHAVHVVYAGDPAKLPVDAAAALAKWQACGGETVNTLPAKTNWSLVIDALFGIGLTREIGEPYAQWIHAVNRMVVPVLAIDAPSGLNADTGYLHGVCVRATHTITFIGAKAGLFTLDGPDHSGEITIDDLDLPIAPNEASGYLLGPGIAGQTIARRQRNSHKGSHGSVGIIGGDSGMVGAALLAGRAALKLGAGRVYLGLLAHDAPLLDAVQPELMLRSAGEVLKLDQLSCIAIGPGLGTTADAAFYLRCALDSTLPLVIDADALNAIAASDTLKTALKQSSSAKLLTPHPAEAARLLGCTTREVQADRIAAATALAERYDAHVVLKGAGSICASPGQPWRINASGNPGMASAGMGDVLTGIMATLLAQGAVPQQALDTAVWLHGAAADACVGNGVGPVGLTATETIDAARRLLNR